MRLIAAQEIHDYNVATLDGASNAIIGLVTSRAHGLGISVTHWRSCSRKVVTPVAIVEFDIHDLHSMSDGVANALLDSMSIDGRLVRLYFHHDAGNSATATRTRQTDGNQDERSDVS